MQNARQRSSSSRPSVRVMHISSEISRITSQLDQRFQQYHREREVNLALVERANRLSRRLQILREKMKSVLDTDKHSLTTPTLTQLTAMMEAEPEDAPPEFICPISQCVMVDPVRTVDGQCYDRASILVWFNNFSDGQRMPTSPLTNLQLSSLELTPDVELREKIRTFLIHSCESANVEQSGEGLTLPVRETGTNAETRSASATGGPIWSSSVVPMNEPNSRILNMIRVDSTIPLPPLPKRPLPKALHSRSSLLKASKRN